MPAYQRHPRSAYPDRWHDCLGYTSLEHLQTEMRNRFYRYGPPRWFDPAWGIEPTIVNNTANGVELWKWLIAEDMWQLDCVIEWRES